MQLWSKRIFIALLLAVFAVGAQAESTGTMWGGSSMLRTGWCSITPKSISRP